MCCSMALLASWCWMASDANTTLKFVMRKETRTITVLFLLEPMGLWCLGLWDKYQRYVNTQDEQPHVGILDLVD